MGTKNLLDNPSSNAKRPAVFSDLTGKETYEPRMDVAAALIFLHEAYAVIAASDPKVSMLAKHFAVNQICYHTGWLPTEIALAEQYVAQASLEIGQPTG